jgi:hypothetical protein
MPKERIKKIFFAFFYDQTPQALHNRQVKLTHLNFINWG